MKGELSQKVMTKIGLRAKVFSYLIDDCREHKNKKNQKKCVIK